MASILVIDDNQTIREGAAAVLERQGHRVYQAEGGRAGVEVFCHRRVDFVITDLKMEDLDGLGVLKAVLERDPQAVVMVITAYGTVETAVEAMKLGAFDFITKPFTPELLRAKTEQVLILGEHGTGKEVVAQMLHSHSRRRHEPLIAVNCAALTETLLESELFGHEKGAFTDARQTRQGKFELASRGTLFLDEIGDMSLAGQAKLLRVLQERAFERVGGEETIQVDVRVIAATNQDLEALVREKRFREDLFYRLHIVPIRLPPLRARTEDIEPLVRHFIAKLARRTGKEISGVEPEVIAALRAYRWPGNVRELENIVEQAMVFAEGARLKLSDLPANIIGQPQRQPEVEVTPAGELKINTSGASLPDILDQVEKALLEQALARARGVKSECARLLGVKTSALYYKLEKHGLLDVEGPPQGG
jgi:two-component system response regulator HydG